MNNNYEIKVGKIDYYTWKIGAIVLLLFCLVLIYMNNSKPTVGEINDNYWHLGYADCERNYNFTSDEMMIINSYRIEQLQNKTMWKYHSTTINVSGEQNDTQRN